MSEITVIIKSSNSDKTTVTADRSLTVIEFKRVIAEKIGVTAEQQRLIHKGRVLKDDLTLESYDVQVQISLLMACYLLRDFL